MARQAPGIDLKQERQVGVIYFEIQRVQIVGAHHPPTVGVMPKGSNTLSLILPIAVEKLDQDNERNIACAEIPVSLVSLETFRAELTREPCLTKVETIAPTTA